jgi:predicted proteasome-type protease
VKLTVASRTDKELNQLMAPIFMEFVDSLDKLWRTKFKTTVRTKASVELLLNLTLYVIGGMGLQSIIHDNPKYYQSLREQWMKMLTPLLSTVNTEQKSSSN